VITFDDLPIHMRGGNGNVSQSVQATVASWAICVT
jgi:hypothetical protein